MVLLEDIGAMAGLVFALAGVGLAQLTGNPRFDAIGTLVIGALRGVIAIVLIVEMKSLLLGEGASPATIDAVESAVRAEVPEARVIYLEPDVERAQAT